MRLLGSSKFGTSYLTVAPLGTKTPHFYMQSHSLNWSPTCMVAALQLVGMSINGSEPGAELVVPKNEKVPLFVEADDTQHIVNWLTSCGEMHDFDLHSAYLVVTPETPQEGELAVILRDDQGGVTWRVWPIRAE